MRINDSAHAQTVVMRATQEKTNDMLLKMNDLTNMKAICLFPGKAKCDLFRCVCEKMSDVCVNLVRR